MPVSKLKKPMTLKKTGTGNLRIYRIDWLDHSGFTRGSWHDTEDTMELDPIFVTSIGYLLKETKEYIILASSITNADHTAGESCILKSCIKKRKFLGY